MPIEIREIIIRTDISVNSRNKSEGIKEKDISLLRKQLLEECKRLISGNTKRTGYKR
jgi:hypothetical protein